MNNERSEGSTENVRRTVVSPQPGQTNIQPTFSEEADTIYAYGVIITVNDAQPSAEAVAVRNGKILAVGARDDVMRYRGPSTEVVDLKGRTMIPGFVDGHSHICDYGMFWGYPTLSPPPGGAGERKEDNNTPLRRVIDEEQD